MITGVKNSNHFASAEQTTRLVIWFLKIRTEKKAEVTSISIQRLTLREQFRQKEVKRWMMVIAGALKN